MRHILLLWLTFPFLACSAQSQEHPPPCKAALSQQEVATYSFLEGMSQSPFYPNLIP
ncbi:MAG: hypothetical protein AAFY71_02805 [Bacteroidota bacterium]